MYRFLQRSYWYSIEIIAPMSIKGAVKKNGHTRSSRRFKLVVILSDGTIRIIRAVLAGDSAIILLSCR